MERILVIEDDEAMRSAYQDELSLEGFTVETAVDGEDGLKKAKTNQPDLILLDMILPKVSGLEFLKQFDVKKTYPQVKVIVFTNLLVPEDEKEVLELGAAKYLLKYDYTPGEIIEVIRRVLYQ